MFTFVKAQTHPKCPRCVGWWLRILPTETATAKAVERCFYKGWASKILERMAQGHTILVNHVGGYCFLTPDMVKGTQQRARLHWPHMTEADLAELEKAA